MYFSPDSMIKYSPSDAGESQEPEAEQPDVNQNEVPAKSPERYRQEELFLWVWRVILIVCIIWGGVYAFWGMTKTPAELEQISEETIHDSLQLGVTIMLGAELLYYLYISSAFRQFRDWGLILWLIGTIVLSFNLI